MVKKTALKLSPVVPRPVDATTANHRPGDTKPLQIRIDPLLHRDIKIAAAEQGKSITAFLLECYEYWRRMNK
ncbi:toxin-antitoxin system HicB family antitoxin [Citrobacter sp. S2-9]|uniref:Toxin-antitoxin system HicB family antitoxin n=1 Tax=Citrobacter enshiensis TaxID=2971264 RepID=A0ABT8PVN7_9ENTR|nr:toxin-antitoxin system HicB family antitoxin [Citrobacter enshiensis]MDN8600324.1 toxin-antitoxin system HicB family antitoxin [Citrobacter enshiensis]